MSESLADAVVMKTYEAVTRGIRVRVEPAFLEDQSVPEDGQYFWAYTIQIENLGTETVQLKTRYWRITDSTGQIQEVRGAGVVGEQPLLRPGDSFEYTSGAPLPTPSGFMGGFYQMQSAGGELFNVEIPTFSLDSPHQDYSLH